MKSFRIVLLALLAILVGIQFVPVDRSNPPVTQEIVAPQAVKDILKRACYDCHSNETQWPWYGHVAPVSLLLANHVEEGREHLNFSEWDQVKDPRHAIEECWEEVEEGEMPLKSYLLLHRSAELSAEDLATLKSWASAYAKHDD